MTTKTAGAAISESIQQGSAQISLPYEALLLVHLLRRAGRAEFSDDETSAVFVGWCPAACAAWRVRLVGVPQ